MRNRFLLFSIIVLLSAIGFSLLESPTASAASPIEVSFFSRSAHRHILGASCLRSVAKPGSLIAFRRQSKPSLAEFVASTRRAAPPTITGVFVCNVLALRVAQQPVDAPIFVSEEFDTATQSRLATDYGTIGLLAHNHLSGSKFFDLANGQEVDLVYGDGTIRRYTVSEIRHFQALDPDNPYSDFSDLDHGGVLFSSAQVFGQIFEAGDRVVFQTCITANGNPSWGRLFVTATPVTDD